MRAQESVAQAVKSANPHTPHIDRQHGAKPRHHFLGGLVGEGDGHYAGGRHLPGLQQPGDTRGQHPGLARAGASQNQRMFSGQRDGGALLGVEVCQQGRGGICFSQHGAIVGSATGRTLIDSNTGPKRLWPGFRCRVRHVPPQPGSGPDQAPTCSPQPYGAWSHHGNF